MKEKINIYMKGISSGRREKNEKMSRKMEELKSEDANEEFEDKIADEENPFYWFWV